MAQFRYPCPAHVISNWWHQEGTRTIDSNEEWQKWQNKSNFWQLPCLATVLEHHFEIWATCHWKVSRPHCLLYRLAAICRAGSVIVHVSLPLKRLTAGFPNESRSAVKVSSLHIYCIRARKTMGSWRHKDGNAFMLKKPMGALQFIW